ncbi:MAG TPA: hypothetical protein VK524_01865 [Polyangiaceae bacterium]|nr:hypothetical protein [Polyangiaceae bacterium]
MPRICARRLLGFHPFSLRERGFQVWLRARRLLATEHQGAGNQSTSKICDLEVTRAAVWHNRSEKPQRSGAQISRIALFVVTCLALSGCSHFERTRECHGLAALINPELDAIERLAKSRPRDVAALGDISLRYAALARKIDQLELTDEMNPIISEYVGSLTRAAIHTRALADGLRDGDQNLARKERTELSRLTRKERVQVAQIASQCRS